MCVFFLLPSRYSLSSVSAVFDTSNSLNDAAPLTPILLSVDVKRFYKSDLLIVFCDFFLCFTVYLKFSE